MKRLTEYAMADKFEAEMRKRYPNAFNGVHDDGSYIRHAYQQGFQAAKRRFKPKPRALSSDVNVMSGTLCIRGTRIPASMLAGWLNRGRTVESFATDRRLPLALVEQAAKELGR